jgi:orotidine-5'-phosphate decarboxylase
VSLLPLWKGAFVRYDEKLEERRRASGSMLCIGLDPEFDKLPGAIAKSPEGVLEFTTAIVDATSDYACAYKPNFAFYEVLGPKGMEVLQRLIQHIPRTIPVIGDAKRSDIANTARLYARAAFEVYDCDALVVDPYQGRDSVEAYMTYPERGIYVLARTSNVGAADFQDQLINGEPLYVRVVRQAQKWKCSGTLGFVVGATAPEQLQRVREAAPDAQLLVPGIGAQGGDLGTVLSHGCRGAGGGLVVSASRSILYASSASNYADAARREAQRLVEEMRRATLVAA